LVVTTADLTLIPRELPIVGGHLALDFANTVDDPEGPARHDHAGTYQELVGWSVRIGVLEPDQADALLVAVATQPRARSAAMRKAHALRRILIKIFTAAALINSGDVSSAETAMPATLWADLRRFVTEAQAHAELALADHVYELTWPMTERLDAVLWPITLGALELLTSPQLARVKKCAGCPWVFLDQSKNLSRRWCAMNDCGTHEKIRRYVSRRAAKKRAGRRS
jgi:predicted RNA-binding Zn ribbon-like protein